jgi:uncharacterized RDD family membrane protein YckC
MRKHRLCEYWYEGRAVPYASLAKRGGAQAIDALLIGGPSTVGWLIMMPMFFDFERMVAGGGITTMVSGFGLMFVGFLWTVGAVLLFSWMEGRSGQSPGKWLFGIRVVNTELYPCGFGSAIIRNLLKFVDGFFHFMVGILVVSFSEKWQRVGDLAAGTIVIQDVNGVRP